MSDPIIDPTVGVDTLPVNSLQQGEMTAGVAGGILATLRQSNDSSASHRRHRVQTYARRLGRQPTAAATVLPATLHSTLRPLSPTIEPT